MDELSYHIPIAEWNEDTRYSNAMSEQVLLVQEPELKEGNPALSRLLDVLRSGYIQEGLLKSTAERLHQVDLDEETG